MSSRVEARAARESERLEVCKADVCQADACEAGIETGVDIRRLEDQIDRLKSSLRVAVVFAGSKSTPGGVVYPSCNNRSWKSYEAVAEDIAASLRRIGFRHVHVMPEDMRLGDRLRRDGVHMAWLNSGGVQGFNSVAHAPATLEMLGVPYIGHDPLSATTLDNKHAFKREAVCAGIPTAPFCTWNMARGPLQPGLNSRFERAFGAYDGPFVVKPVSGRASLHVHVVEDRAGLPGMVAEVHRATQNLVMIEKYLPGREYCIAVAGPITSRNRRLNQGRHPFAFAALERVLSPDEKIFTSMDFKPITEDRFRSLDAHRDAKPLARMRQLAREVFLEFSLGALIRLDIRADEHGELYVLEANPKPDLKRPEAGVTNLISAGLPECGMDYDDLILSLFADRLHFLFTHRREGMQHILRLAEPVARNGSGEAAGRASAGADKIGQAVAALNEAVAELNVRALDATLDRTREAQSVPEPAAPTATSTGHQAA